MAQGTITMLNLERGFGFVRVHGSPDLFFHISSLSDELAFNDTLVERRVEFDVVEGPKGQRAINLRPAS